MLNRIDNVKPLSVPRMHGRARRHTDQLLTLIGDGSDADDVLSFFRELWPEVEGADRAGASVSLAEVAHQTALEQEHNNGCGRTGAHQQVAVPLANCTAEVKEVEAYGDIWNTAANMPHFLRHPMNRLAFQTWSKDSCCFRACKWQAGSSAAGCPAELLNVSTRSVATASRVRHGAAESVVLAAKAVGSRARR